MLVDTNSLALVVAGLVVIAALALAAFTVHRLADTNAKKIVAVIVTIVVLLEALPPLAQAFLVI